MMRTFTKTAIAGFAALAFQASAALAHTPLCACYDNGDGTILCEGSFSDGASAAGVKMVVKDKTGTAIKEGEMNKNSEFEFKKPDGDFTVIFEGGDGHQIEIKSSDISK